MPQHEPDVAFGLHPDLGIIAAVSDDNQYLPAVPAERGFKYNESLDHSVIPSEIPRSEPKHSGWMVDVARVVAVQRSSTRSSPRPLRRRAPHSLAARPRSAPGPARRRPPPRDRAVKSFAPAPPTTPPPRTPGLRPTPHLFPATPDRRSALPETPAEPFMTIRHTVTGEITTTGYNAAARRILLQAGFEETPGCACRATEPGTERPDRQPASCSSPTVPCPWTEPSVGR